MTAASETVAKAAKDAKKAIVEADASSRKEFTEAVATAKRDLTTKFAGSSAATAPNSWNACNRCWTSSAPSSTPNPERGAAELLDKAVKQFDPSDPTSPMAKHTAELANANRTHRTHRKEPR